MNSNKNTLLKGIKTILSKWGFTKKGLFLNSKGEWYLFPQLLLILLHFIPPFPKIEHIPFQLNTLHITIGLIILFQGLRIAVQAFIDLGDNLTPLPYPMNDSNFVNNNSYKNTRHPLYKGLLFISLGICIYSLSLIHLFLLLLLAYNLKTKAIKEEERLKIKFPEYEKYIEKVPAIVNKIKYLDWRE